MTPEATPRLVELFDRVVSSPREMRSKILAELRSDDPEMASELASLLSAHDSSDDYFGKLSRDVIAPAVIAVSLDETDAGGNLQGRLEKALAPAYRIERELGGGGMSRVFLAEEIRLARKVVIKVLPPDMSVGVSVERFQREIQLSARLQHPHIVHVLTSDAADDLLYYVMPFVDGETLRSRISRDGPLPVGDALAIWRDLLDALGFAHQQGIVHRDVKPENILLSGRHALIADFGIARALEAAADEKENTTTAGVTLGTPAYMAPEQVSGEGNADHRIDIYAAGLVMYEMLSGRTPFAGRGKRETVLAHVAETPPPIARGDVPPALDQLVMRCLEKLPESRPQSAESILGELDKISLANARPIPRKWSTASIAAAAVAVIMLFVGGAYFALRGTTSPTRELAAVARLTDDATPSLVVLPLANRSPDPADAGLADGMTEELIGTLSRDSSLRVIASTSSFALKGTQRTIRQIADSLNVSNVLEGSLQKIGSRLRMQVRLIGAANGSTRWSQVYDRQMNDLFAVQEDISRAVASELDVQLRNQVLSNRRPRHTPNVVAYEWYARGMDRVKMGNDSAQRRAIEYFNLAIAADSIFAAPYAGLVRAYLNIGNARRDGNGRAWFERAEKAALKAVALDPSLAEAHAALGWARIAVKDYANSELAFNKAMSLNPSASRLHEGLARLYMQTDRPSEQLAEARAGLAVDPFSTSAMRELALALMMNGRCDEALELLKPLKSLSPPAGVAGIVRGQCFESKQMWNEAIAEYQWAGPHSAASSDAFLGHALARAGRQDEARHILSDLMSGAKSSHGAFGIAVVYAGLRDYDNAFAWLNKAVDENSITAYLAEPMFADLHADPRYAAIRKRMQNPRR